MNAATILGAVVTVAVSVAALVGAWLTARMGGRAAPYAAISDRVQYLEAEAIRMDLERREDRKRTEQLEETSRTRTEELERVLSAYIADRDELVAYFSRDLSPWVTSGSPPPPPPVPKHLLDFLPDWNPPPAEPKQD